MEDLSPDVYNYILSELLDYNDLMSLKSTSKTLNEKINTMHKLNHVRKYILSQKSQLESSTDLADLLLEVMQMMNPNKKYRVVDDFDYDVYGENEGLIYIKIFEVGKRTPVLYLNITDHNGSDFEFAPKWLEVLYFETGLYRIAKELIMNLNSI